MCLHANDSPTELEGADAGAWLWDVYVPAAKTVKTTAIEQFSTVVDTLFIAYMVFLDRAVYTDAQSRRGSSIKLCQI